MASAITIGYRGNERRGIHTGNERPRSYVREARNRRLFAARNRDHRATCNAARANNANNPDWLIGRAMTAAAAALLVGIARVV
jgi:hypothetical protein